MKSFFERLLLKKHIDSKIDRKSEDIGNLGVLFYSLIERNFDCKNILDIGANKGEWSMLAKKMFPDANLYMVEPLSEMEPYLKSFCREHPGSKYYLFGIGSRVEKRFLTTWGESLEGANFMIEENDHLKAKNLQREIQLVTIDKLIDDAKIPVPDIVKIDVQGYELEALKGAKKLFSKTELFIIECSLFEFSKDTPLVSDIMEFMKSSGYEVYDFAGFLRRPFDGAIAQVDICFARREGKLRASNAWFKQQA